MPASCRQQQLPLLHLLKVRGLHGPYILHLLMFCKQVSISSKVQRKTNLFFLRCIRRV